MAQAAAPTCSRQIYDIRPLTPSQDSTLPMAVFSRFQCSCSQSPDSGHATVTLEMNPHHVFRFPSYLQSEVVRRLSTPLYHPQPSGIMTH